MIPYKFDEGAASKIATKLGSAAASAIQFRGKYKAAPLVAQEAEEKKTKDEADRKAKTDAAHADRLAKTKELATARASGSISREKARQNTIKAQTKLSETRAKEKATPRAGVVKPEAAKKPAASKALKVTADDTSVGKSVPNVVKPINPTKTDAKKPRPKVDTEAAGRYDD
jgi:hypothetical protein